MRACGRAGLRPRVRALVACIVQWLTCRIAIIYDIASVFVRVSHQHDGHHARHAWESERVVVVVVVVVVVAVVMVVVVVVVVVVVLLLLLPGLARSVR